MSGKANGLTGLSPDELRAFMRDNFPKHLQPAEPEQATPTQKKICVALLAYDGRIHTRTAMSLMQSVSHCAQRGWAFCYILREGDSMVARGRSLLASQFLQQDATADATDLVFVDTDLSWDGDELARLCAHDVDVVGAAYPYKNDSGEFPLRWSSQGIIEQNGLWQVQATTPGFFRVTRRALIRIAQECPWLAFHDQATPEHKAWMFFDNAVRPNGVYDEGYIFCEHWRSVGGTCWADPDIKLSHIGAKAFSHGTLREWLERKAETTEKLIHDFPDIPPLKLVAKAMGEKIDLEAERAKAHDQHRDAGQAAAPGHDGGVDAPQHEAGVDAAPDLGGRGRRRNHRGRAQAATRQPDHHLGETTRG